MPKLTPMDVFDNPITTEGYMSSDWGLPGEDPDEAYQDTGYPGEIAGPNYLLEESQAGVYDQASRGLFDFTDAYGGSSEAFGGAPGLFQPTSFGLSIAAPSARAASDREILRLGSTGPAVENWKAFLRMNGLLRDAVQSGGFDQATEEATIAFQRRKGITADGIVGPQTRAAMNAPDASTQSQLLAPTPPLPTDQTQLFTTRNIAIGLIGLSVLGTIAVVAFGGDE